MHMCMWRSREVGYLGTRMGTSHDVRSASQEATAEPAVRSGHSSPSAGDCHASTPRVARHMPTQNTHATRESTERAGRSREIARPLASPEGVATRKPTRAHNHNGPIGSRARLPEIVTLSTLCTRTARPRPWASCRCMGGAGGAGARTHQVAPALPSCTHDVRRASESSPASPAKSSRPSTWSSSARGAPTAARDGSSRLGACMAVSLRGGPRCPRGGT